MGDVKTLLDSLLLKIYGESKSRIVKHSSRKACLEQLELKGLYKIETSLRKNMLIVGIYLRDELIKRDRYRRTQERLCDYVDLALNILADNNYPPLRFSLTPPPAKSPHFITSPTNSKNNNYSDNVRLRTVINSTNQTVRMNLNNNMQSKQRGNDQHRIVIKSPNSGTEISSDKSIVTSSDVQDDYHQWLHAMKLVARLPGGMPPEFRRKLWLTLAEKYLKSRNVEWEKEEKKCFSEEWREDDEELGIQIVKDLHRTGSNLCSGPAAKVNQARLKRVLLGYARYNPEVGYCQGFNMLGALILQVMDKEEVESIKVMIYLVEGILPPGYFCGSMGGLQADMGVFRELMQCKLPRLAKHLLKLQGPGENAFEPPLTNVFTMQWFLTMYCTCLPMTCVLRVWDLVLIEGSDVLLRTSLVLWGLLEERVLSTRSADDFYCKMGSFASELLNGHLIDSNSLIEKIVNLGPIMDIDKLRNKHLYHITPIKHTSNLPLYLDEEEECDNDEDSRLAVATVWGIPWTRRGSQSAANAKQVPTVENKERLALDISLLKKQYDKLRERQKQAHIIITTACSTARQGNTTNVSPSVVPLNQLLAGRSAIVTHQGRRTAPVGAIPPARKPSLPSILHTKPAKKQLRRGETLHWRDTDLSMRRRDSLTWKEIKADRNSRSKDEKSKGLQSQKLHSRVGKSDSSSYSEESDDEPTGSSTDTSLCDDDATSTGEKTRPSSIENSPKRHSKISRRKKGSETKLLAANYYPVESHKERIRPKSWAPSTDEIPFMLLTSDSDRVDKVSTYNDDKEEENNTSIPTECDRKNLKKLKSSECVMSNYGYSPIAGDLATTTLEPLDIQTDIIELPIITSTSQLSPMPDITSFLNETPISPLPTPKPLLNSVNSLGSCDGDETKKFDVNDDGVTNQYFERVNSVEHPTNLDIFFSLNEDDSFTQSYQASAEDLNIENIKVSNFEPKSLSHDNYRPDLLIDHPQNLLIEKINESIKSTINEIIFDPIAVLGERDDNIPGENLDDFREDVYTDPVIDKTEVEISPPTSNSYLSRASQKRRDPRRLTVTRSTTMDIEERFQALEKHFSNEMSTQSNCIIPSDSLTAEEHVNDKQQSTTQHIAYDDNKNSGLDKLANFEISNRETLYDPLKEETLLTTRPPIPSTNDLEERYERQMSASDKMNKENVTLPKSSKSSDQTNGSDSSKKETIKREVQDNKLKKESETSAEKEEDSRNSKSLKENISSPKRMPTTAELEKRFDALEVKSDVEKKSPTKQKKEPPDIESKAKVKSEASENRIKCDYDTSKEKCKEIEESCDDKHELAKKKTPPSTEELEKRFHALEKQMSTSTMASDSHEHVESSHPKTTIKLEHSSKAITSDLRRQSQDNNGKEFAKIKDPSNAREISIETKKVDYEENPKSTKSGRRASEPPSTEDLEKRYESLKRRMSTRTSFEKAAQSETTGEALRRIEKIILTEINVNENPELNISPQLTTITESEARKDTPVQKVLEAEKDKDGAAKNKDRQEKQVSKVNDEKKHKEPTKSEEEHSIPIAPPLPPSSKEEKSLLNVVVSRERQALIEELQSKIHSISDDETFKPSSINPNRKTPTRQLEQSSLKNDDISEAHALTAFLRSGNNELWQGYTPKVVRRFSDLPSRADLENRLEFLEQKFYKKLYKQRCASDSEVASRKNLIDESPKPSSSSASASMRMEQRLQALEKQLSENSLKLLEAMRAKSQNNVGDSESPRRLSIDTIDGTGKELVRYTHVGEFEDSGVSKPINISINIKMTLDKSVEASIETGPLISSELERRLEALEHQIQESKKAKTSTHENLPQMEPVNEPQNHTVSAKPESFASEHEENKSILPKNDLSNQREIQPIEAQKAEPDKCAMKNRESTHQNGNLKEKTCSELETRQAESVRKIMKQSPNVEPNLQEKSEKVIEESSEKQNEEVCIKNIKMAGSNQNGDLKDRKSGEQDKSKDRNLKSVSVSSQKESISVSNKSEFNKTDDAEKSGGHAKSDNKKASPSQQVDTKISENRIEKYGEDLKGVQKSHEKSNEKSETETVQKKKENIEKPCDEKASKELENHNEEPINSECQILPEKLIVNTSEIGTVDANKKTLVLLLDNEPKAVKVRRLTRANTEELEGLFQALEKQLHERNLVKSDDGTLKHIDSKNEVKEPTNEAKVISELTKEFEEFTHAEKGEIKKPTEPEEEKPYDWGADPVKRHLKRKTAHLPSTKELEARFRSLERQIKLLEDVEKIDVEQRLHEIERKIKLQYSLANEKDLTKYLELCEGKGLEDEPFATPTTKEKETRCECGRRTPSKEKQQTPKTSPGGKTERTSSRSPSRKAVAQSSSPPPPTSCNEKDRVSRERSIVNKMNAEQKKQPIHPLEMLLDPSPDDSKIPTTGELEHRIRVLDKKHRSPTPPRKSRSRSPAADSSRKIATTEEKIYTKQPLHSYKKYDITPEKPEPPTAEELEARMRALEEDHIFDPKTQRNFKEFNEKLKNVISPSVSFEENYIDPIREVSPRRYTDSYRSPTSRSALHSSEADVIKPRSTSPKVIRFSDEEDGTSSTRTYRDTAEQRKSTLAEPKEGRTTSYDSILTPYTSEGLDAMGSRLMRQTSPLRRTGTHTGVPLRTDDNINERLSSIKDTIKSIDSLCEEKPYRSEKCQRYIDSLFSDSSYFAQKKTSLEELRSRSASRSRHADYTPSIHVSDLSQRPSDYYLSRSIGSAESIRTTSPLRAASPLHYRSNRELTRNSDVSPARRGRRYDEDHEEYESRVRRNYMLPNSFLDNHSNLRNSGSSLTKFYKVDSQLDSYERDKSSSHSPSRSPLKSSAYELRDTTMLHNSQNSYNTALNTQSKTFDLDKQTSPYRQTSHNLLSTDYTKRLNNPPVYNPSKLEIRHTTVTSTFYDRLLTEKQLEKSFSRTPSRSPIQTTSTTTTTVTTSVAEKSYLDTTTKIGANSYNFTSSLSPTYTVQTTLHQNTNTTSTATTATAAALTGSIVLPTPTTTATPTTYSMTPFSINSTLSSYLNNKNETTPVLATTTTSNLSEPIHLASTSSSSYLNLLSSTTSSAVVNTSYSSFLPSISDTISTAFPSSTISTLSTVPPLVSSTPISTLPSYTSAATTGATYPSVSLPFQSSSLNSNILGIYSNSAPKTPGNITIESYSSTTK